MLKELKVIVHWHWCYWALALQGLQQRLKGRFPLKTGFFLWYLGLPRGVAQGRNQSSAGRVSGGGPAAAGRCEGEGPWRRDRVEMEAVTEGSWEALPVALSPGVLRALRGLGFTGMTPVQVRGEPPAPGGGKEGELRAL